MLEALGVNLDLPIEHLPRVVDEVGITFCFAPMFHASFRHVGAPRRELGIATVFNFLGPLTNPARPAASAVGCADARMAPLMAGVLADERHHDDHLDSVVERWRRNKSACTRST